ncbi:hypothetical protein MCOR07_003706 [Pyricularia oryzae]|uniref:ENTH domain-containing protein n=2 Tax=Pyricularia TaxID=48558 RepID=A0ABQ8NBN4_PYRGI|nr:hypothetical protein MCOR01_005043 [Pyricularia oryzae]KAI6294502.1 hypothetical protein MCOR33_008380 [Pyricularia grisea]KAI6261088.1 hypothetical protein MCOR19_002630 [Pyricularia oryzae]KAI6277005.1 hypothetical protein MCOR26_005360 [Pyricularia oryzae]KAI6328697.1 hypothetical protein MCOR29_002513 [Pyricularia oryzae]
MASSFEKSVKGATKIKAAPPKTKYIEHILIATHAGEAGVGEVFRALQNRLRDSTWTVVFKSLITVHLMIREGSPDVTLSYLARHRSMLAISMFSDAQTQGRNIRHYAEYLEERARAYKHTRVDWVRAKESRLEKLTIDKGLLRETEVVQQQLTALLKCNVLENDPENEITITVFRLLVLDLLALFQVLNQAMINILGHFFEMSKVDADRAMGIYRAFTRQTDYVVQFLSVARQHEHHTRVEVPKLRHAPVNLGRQLEDYLKDPDFEINRRQYLAELEAKKNKPSGSSATKKFGAGAQVASKTTSNQTSAPAANGTTKQETAAATKAPEPDLIDFFDFIEQKQAPAQAQPQVQANMSPWGNQAAPNMGGFQAQPTGQQFQTNSFIPQQTGFQATNPFQQQNFGAFSPQQQPQSPPQQQPQQQMMPQYTGAAFGGMPAQTGFQPSALGSIPQDSVASFQTNSTLSALNLQTGQQQVTNPFRASMMTTGQQPQMTGQLQQQSTNPFARPQTQASQQPALSGSSPFQSQPPAAAPLQPMATGTNPFARNGTAGMQRPATSGALVPQPTGSTNPFRQSAFTNHSTGMGWQQHQQPIGGGLDHFETIPVFPRPTTSSPWQS